MRKLFSAAVILLASLMQGCGQPPREADFVFVVFDEHVSLDPQKMSWLNDGRIVRQLFEGLVTIDPRDLSVQPGVAEKWEVSDDGTTWTFHFREGVKWSNGDPVRAGDFIYSWRRAMTPDLSADYTELFFHVRGARDFFDWRTKQLAAYREGDDKSAEAAEKAWQEAVAEFEKLVGMSAPDDRTLVIELENQTPYFLELLGFFTFVPVHPPSVKQTESFVADSGMLQSDASYWTDASRHISNGPYVLKRHRFKRDLLIVANDQWWNRASMKNTSVLERIIPEVQTALLAYQRGEIDWMPSVPDQVIASDLLNQNRPDVHAEPSAGVYFYNFNCQEKLSDGSPNPMADPRVRRALAMAVDTKTIVEKVTRQNQPTTRTFVPKDAITGYNPPADAGVEFDPAAARKLLAEAGFPKDALPKGLSILYNTGHGHETIAEAIKAMWEENLGLIVTLEGVEVKSFAERMKKHDFSICRAGWFGDYRDPTTWLDKMVTGNGNNDCAYSSPEYDALMAKAAKETDPKTRMGILREAEAVMLRDAPMIMIYQYVEINLYDPQRVKDLHLNPWAEHSLEEVSVVKSKE